MSRANEVFNYEKKLESELRKVDADNLNGGQLRKYYSYSIADGLGLGRVVKRLCQLRYMSRLLNKPYEHATKEDIVELVARIERAKLADWTKRDYKLILRQFLTWLKGFEKGHYPPEVSWMHIPKYRLSTVRKQDLLTWDEIQRMTSLTRNVRDRAFILVLFDSGLRISEILPLRIEDVEFNEGGAILYTDGKTGRAPGIIGWSAPTLATWLDHHPFKLDPKAPVWCDLGATTPRMISYTRSSALIKRYARKAGITRRVWHHLFKHTAATRDSKKLPSALMNLKYHWKQYSEMPSFYVHLSGEDLKEVQHILYGVTPNGQAEEPKLVALKCQRCTAQISPDSSFCNKCGLALTTKGELDYRMKTQQVDDLLNAIANNPIKRKKLVELIQS